MIANITLTDAPAPDTRKAIGELMMKFNNSRIGHTEVYHPLAIVLTDPDSGDIVGGLHGATMFSYLHVDLLFIPDALRGQGLGSRLLRQAEDEAKQRGCVAVSLDTFSFQARGFYEKLGYAVF